MPGWMAAARMGAMLDPASRRGVALDPNKGMLLPPPPKQDLDPALLKLLRKVWYACICLLKFPPPPPLAHFLCCRGMACK